MDWMNTIKALAPTVASALGSPLAGAAVSALCSIFGVADGTQDTIKTIITNGQMTADQISKIRELELKYQSEEKERGFRYAELEVKDRGDARIREIQTGDKVNRNLAYFIVLSFVAVVVSTLMGWTKAESVLAGTLIGYLSAKTEQVLSYYYGSNKSSDRKTELLAQSPAIKQDTA